MSHSQMLANRRKRQAQKKRLVTEAKEEKKLRKATVKASAGATGRKGAA